MDVAQPRAKKAGPPPGVTLLSTDMMFLEAVLFISENSGYMVHREDSASFRHSDEHGPPVGFRDRAPVTDCTLPMDFEVSFGLLPYVVDIDVRLQWLLRLQSPSIVRTVGRNLDVRNI